MKRLIIRSFTLLLVIFPLSTIGQTLFSNGSVIFISGGGIVHSNGGVTLENGSSLTNNGELRLTKNSTFLLPGTFTNDVGSMVNGNGMYYVEQDWINNSLFTADLSSVVLNGNTQQYITSTNGTITEFNNLILLGTGTGNNRKKTLQGVDARISVTGVLTINNRELATETNDMIVLNPSPNAVTNFQGFGTEGFVSSEVPGYLNWMTNSTSNYVFPVGSSDGTVRYRPVAIRPKSIQADNYSVRLNNTSGDDYGYFLAQHDEQISLLNSNFFHSIEQASGLYSADVSLTYLPSTDGDWSSMAQWSNSSGQWNSAGATNSATLGSYSTVQKADWNFSNPAHPYILVNLNEELHIPNVFTPNQDGVNDSYLITAKGILEFNIVIVNRWGNVVFESNDILNSWDGTANGQPCQDGVYFYVIKAKSATQDYSKHGHITLNAN